MFALALPLTAALYIGAEGIDPKGTDQIVTTTAVALKVLPIAAKHHTQLSISGSLTELALGALIISYGAIAMLIRKRGSTAATIAVLLGGIGAFCGVVVNVLGGINLAAAATAHVPRDAAARLLVTNFNSGPGQAFTDVYAFSEFVAPIIMGVALWRSGRVPRWLAVLFAWASSLPNRRRPSVSPGSFCKWRRSRWRWSCSRSASGERPTKLRRSVTITSRCSQLPDGGT